MGSKEAEKGKRQEVNPLESWRLGRKHRAIMAWLTGYEKFGFATLRDICDGTQIDQEAARRCVRDLWVAQRVVRRRFGVGKHWYYGYALLRKE